MAGRELKDGEQLLLRGSAGALFRVTVGQPFTREYVEGRLKSGEWSWPGSSPTPPAEAKPEPRTEEPSKPAPGGDSPKPRTQPEQDDDPDRPAQSAPKSEWVAYVARTQHMSREDAANYTKADLIDMVS